MRSQPGPQSWTARHRKIAQMMRLMLLRSCASAFLLLTATGVMAAEIRVSPTAVTFADAFARRQLLVSVDGRDATRQSQYASGNPQFATVDPHGYVVPVANGQTEITVTIADRTVRIPVTVTGLDQLRAVDFTTEIEPLLSRFGCNSGGCHGKASGQNGFKLSLFGFDADFDYNALVKEARGRRVFATAPENSLLLTKATGQVPHGGGRRIEPGSEPYRLLL